MKENKTMNLFKEHYEFLLNKYDGRSIPMKLIKCMIESVSLELEPSNKEL